MTSNNVSPVYVHVIDDVVNKVREDFMASGTGESVLSELQMIWEMKMVQCGAILSNFERPTQAKLSASITPVHDLNVPYEGPMEEYETPTAEMLFPPTPLQTPMQTPLPGTVDHYNIPTSGSDYGPATDVGNGDELKSGRPNPYMPTPSPWMTHRPLGVDVNVAYVEGRDEVDRGASQQQSTQDFFSMPGGKRKRDDYASQLASSRYLPQQDGTGDLSVEFVVPETSQILNLAARIPGKGIGASQVIPQGDGVHDEYDDIFHFPGVVNEEYNTPTPAEHVELRSPAPLVGTPKPAKIDLDDDEPPLNEDDDDEEDLHELDEEEEVPSTQHLVLAQFEKVSRTKSRWKCTLKDGIMHLNGRDMLFNKANGEFDF